MALVAFRSNVINHISTVIEHKPGDTIVLRCRISESKVATWTYTIVQPVNEPGIPGYHYEASLLYQEIDSPLFVDSGKADQ